MKQLKLKQELSILEAVDYLSSLSEIDITLSSKVAVEEEKDTLHPHRWLNPQLISKNQELIVQAFRAVHHYAQELYEKHADHLKDMHILKGLQAILSILDEAVEKIEKFTDLFKEDPALESLMELEEYRNLQEYLASYILPQISELENYWEADLGVHEEELIGIAKKGVRDVEDIKEDKFYDLLYLKKEDKKPFYDYDMVRRLKLLYDFDQVVELGEEENSFIRIRQLQDKDFHQKASSILQGSTHLIGIFYKEAMKMKTAPLVAALNKCLMALMLSANPRNWHSASLEEGEHFFKSSAEYFGDFHFYLREALHAPEFKKMLQGKFDPNQPIFQSCFTLVHKLCAAYFLTVSIQKEMVSFIRRIMHMGSKMTHVQEPGGKEASFWKELLWEDDSIRQVFQKQPNGPIRCVIESFLRGEIARGWDPLSFKNIPSHLFTLTGKEKETHVLRMPAPLMQKSIQTAEVAPEFEQFLRSFISGDRHQTFLLVNLQDRTSWEEHARSETLENFANQEEFVRVLSVVGLPKKTDFYFQKDVYQDVNEASIFLEQVVEQFEGREQCGFHWPQMHEVESNAFAKEAVHMIHHVFFAQKKTLSVSERQSFIEIFYFFLLLKAMELFHPDYMTLSCKDSIDTGAAATGGFFSCIRTLISQEPWTETEKDLLLWILYAPALFFRERAVQKADVTRLIETMACFQEGISKHRDLLVKECKKLYQESFWTGIEIKKAS